MSRCPRSPLSRLGMAAGLAAALAFAAEPLVAQGPPAGRPPTVRPPHGHDRSNIPPRARPVPPHGHDRSNIPPRANPNPPGQGTPHGPSDPVGPSRPGNRGQGGSNGQAGSAGQSGGPGQQGGPNRSISANGDVAGGADGNIARALGNAELTLSSGAAIPAASQRAVLNLVQSARPGAARPVAAALAPAENARAESEAARLAADMEGLLANPEGLQRAVLSYNALVDASSEAFLRNPSGEFLATQSVLSLLVEEAFTAGSVR